MYLGKRIREASNDYAGMDVFYTNAGLPSALSYIAHGGGIGEFLYTNSKEAVIDSIKRGFVFIEIDMLVTKDKHIIGGHDWNHFKKITNIQDSTDEPLTLADAHSLLIKNKYHVLTGADIAKLMNENKNIIIVTDKIDDYELLLKEIPFPERLIVEVFDADNYLRALQAGIKYPAFCIWGEYELALENAFEFPIATVGSYFFTDGDTADVKKMHDANITLLFFHGGKHEDPEFLAKHLGTYFSKIYTNRYSPQDFSEK